MAEQPAGTEAAGRDPMQDALEVIALLQPQREEAEALLADDPHNLELRQLIDETDRELDAAFGTVVEIDWKRAALFSDGQQVQVNYDGNDWYTGTIVAVNALNRTTRQRQTYEVEITGYELRETATVDRLRRVVLPDVFKGEKVHAISSAGFHAGVVESLSEDPNKVVVRFTGEPLDGKTEEVPLATLRTGRFYKVLRKRPKTEDERKQWEQDKKSRRKENLQKKRQHKEEQAVDQQKSWKEFRTEMGGGRPASKKSSIIE